MANNFAEALFGARDNARDRIRQQEIDAQANQMRQFQMEQAQTQATNAAQDRSQNQLLSIARGWKTVQPQNRLAYYENFIKPAIAQKFGDPGPYDENAINGVADQIIAANTPVGGSELAPRVVGNALVDPTGKVLYQAPQEAPKPIWDSERGVFIQYPTQGAASAPAGGDVQGLYASLGDKYGFRTTSTTRSAEENQRVGGVPNSQHLSGTARDFSVQGKTPEQISAFVNELRSQGFEVITRDHGTGPHIHAELPPGRQPVGGASAIPVPGVAPKAATVPAGYSVNPDGTMAAIPGGPADKQNNPVAADLAKGEMGLRKEIQDRVKSDRTILGMYTNVQNAANTPSAAGDLSMIFAFMKMLDPGSVVREQEFANAQNAAGVPDQVRNAYNRAKSGERLNPQQRADFVNQARNLADAATGRITAITREYQGIADQYGWDPVRATGQADFRDVSAGPAQPSQIARPTTEAEYNALPSGAIFIDPEDGKQYRKP